MNEFFQLILGVTSLAMYAALLFFACVGILINLLFHSTSRDQNSPNTPVKFSFRFLLWDNWKRIILSILVILVLIRFVSFFFDFDVVNNNELYLFLALLVGMSFDKGAEILKAKTTWLKVRENPPAPVP
jgi:hypothetical protein